jgi:hypothetical protein
MHVAIFCSLIAMRLAVRISENTHTTKSRFALVGEQAIYLKGQHVVLNSIAKTVLNYLSHFP